MKYIESVTEDVLEYIRDESIEVGADLDALAERLNDELWDVDSVTGNASGSYTFNRQKAKENVMDDTETVLEALEEFGVPAETIAEKFLSENWEWFDVTARCYVLGQAISRALDSLKK